MVVTIERPARPRFDFGDVEWKGHTVTLTHTQYRVLLRLVAAAPHAITTPKLHREVFGTEWSLQDPRVRVHIQGLRQRLKDAEMPIRIESRNRFGYRAVLN